MKGTTKRIEIVCVSVLFQPKKENTWALTGIGKALSVSVLLT